MNSRLEQQTRSSREDLRRFVSFVTHELRNPLSAISTAAELLAGSGGNREAAAVLRRQVRHLSTLLRDVGDELRLGRTSLEVHAVACELGTILRDAVEVASPEFRHRGQVFVNRASGAIARIRADPNRLQQVFANLLINASRYTPENGEVQLRLRSAGDVCIVDIADTGAGLSASDADRIFRPFARVASDAQGTGVGLAVAKEIVEEHGGSLSVRSRGPGLGSTFTVTIPIEAHAASRRSQRDEFE